MRLWDWTLFNIYLWINFSTSALSGMLLFFKLTVYNLAKALRCCFECIYWFLKCSFATHQLSFNTQIHNKTTIYWSLCQKLAKKNISKVDVLYCFTELKSESYLVVRGWWCTHSVDTARWYSWETGDQAPGSLCPLCQVRAGCTLCSSTSNSLRHMLTTCSTRSSLRPLEKNNIKK